MALIPRAIAVEGVGYSPALLAVLGLYPEETASYDISRSDTVATVDSLIRTVEFGRPITDLLVVTDVSLRALDYSRTQSDSPLVTDSFYRSLEYGRALVDLATVTDTLARALDYNLTRSDVVLAADALARALEYGRSGSDAVSAAEVIARSAEYSRTHSDVAAVTEALARALQFLRNPADASAVTDVADITTNTAELISATAILDLGLRLALSAALRHTTLHPVQIVTPLDVFALDGYIYVVADRRTELSELEEAMLAKSLAPQKLFRASGEGVYRTDLRLSQVKERLSFFVRHKMVRLYTQNPITEPYQPWRPLLG